jgi:hypothetical protein
MMGVKSKGGFWQKRTQVAEDLRRKNHVRYEKEVGMKRMAKFACLASATVMLAGTFVWADSRTVSNKGASGTAVQNLSYETGEEELRANIKVGQTATIKITKCSNCFFEGFINMGDIIQLKRIDSHTFNVKGLKPGNCVIDFTDKTQPKMKTRATVKVVLK